MEFFDKLGKKASEAYKITADKTGKIAKETKIKFKINDLKSQINDTYEEIGKNVYEKHVKKENISVSDFEEECTKIDVLSDEIEGLLKECLDLKDKKQCPKCYKEIEKDPKIRVLRWEREFNYSAINNFGASQAKGEYLLLLNNDTEVITRGWMKELLSHCQRPEVGMVGAKLYFPDNTIQSAGTIIGMGGMADHAFVNMDRKKSGYMHRASIQVDMSGVTAACAMVKRSVYEEVGGLEEKLTVAFNDVDLGLKIVTAGYLIVFDPYAELYHYESKSRGVNDEKKERHAREVRYTQEKWADFLAAGDPCYNQNLTLAKHNFSLRK